MHWELNKLSEELIESKAREWEVSNFLATMLLNKGFEEKESVTDFLNPAINKLQDPFLFEDMEKVVEKILLAKKRKEKIFVYGDYDVDGITAASFLTIVFRKIGIEIDYYISKRSEGSGLNENVIKELHKKSAKLIITVDTGIEMVDCIEYAKSLGIEIIVTDHHKSIKEIVNSEQLCINPKVSEKYKFKLLSGAGVALKVAQAVYIRLNENLGELYKFIDLVMIGTVADVVPLIEENRIIVSEGMKTLKKTQVKGLISLKNYLKLNKKEIETADISFYLAPMLNSLGRLGNSQLGADFLLENNGVVIFDIIEEMKKSNLKRRAIEREISDEANEMIETKLIEDNKELKYIFVSSDKWHPGIIGAVASKLTSKYSVPAIVISVKDGLVKASCRSVPEVNVFDILKKAENKLMRFGGHDLAAGFIAEEKHLEEIELQFKNETEVVKIEKSKIKSLNIDCELSIENLSKDKFKDLIKISPFGLGNKQPNFLSKDVKLLNIKFFGVNLNHFRGTITKKGKKYPVIAFNLGTKIQNIEDGRYDVVYYPEKLKNETGEFFRIHLIDLKHI